MDTHRRIIHLDLDAFFCAVEELRDPSLRGKAFAVGGRPDQRGVVASCSYAARRCGVRSAMPMSRALRLCPNLIIIPGRHRAYSDASRQVMERLRALTPQVEQISIDEAFLDVTGLPEPADVLARRLQAQIRQELDLPCSLGVASNKLVAKIATDVGKAANRGDGPPNAVMIVPEGGEAAFLAPLPAGMLWGVGPKTAEKLAEMGISTIGDLASWPEADLLRRFGKNGVEMARHARGIDTSPIVVFHEAKSFSQETTFAQDIRDEQVLRQTLRQQAADVARHLQKHQKHGTTVKIKLRWPDFTTLSRQVTLDEPTDQAEAIANAALSLFEKIWTYGRAVRLLGVGVSGLASRPRQLNLWDVESEKDRRVRQVIADLQNRFGDKVVRRGGLDLRNDPGEDRDRRR